MALGFDRVEAGDFPLDVSDIVEPDAGQLTNQTSLIYKPCSSLPWHDETWALLFLAAVNLRQCVAKASDGRMIHLDSNLTKNRGKNSFLNEFITFSTGQGESPV